MVEKERVYWVSRSKVPQHCYQLVASYEIFFGSYLQALNFLLTAGLLLPLYQWLQVDHHWLLLSLLYLLASLAYAKAFAFAWDSLRKNRRDFSLLRMKLLEGAKFKHFLQERHDLQLKILKLMEELGPKVIV
jgi:hypothetical protein